MYDGKTELLIKTEFAGDVTVQWDAVTAIVAPEALHLTLKDGQTVVGPVTTADGKFDVTTASTGEVAAPKDTVVTVRNDAEQKAYDAEARTPPRARAVAARILGANCRS